LQKQRENFEPFVSLKLLIWHQKWVTPVQQLALQSLSPGRKIILAFTTKCAVPRQMKTRFLDLNVRGSKATEKDLIVFLFLSWDG